MNNRYTSLTLNGKHHSGAELMRLAEVYHSEFALAGWEKKLFQLIGEWLSDERTLEVHTSGSTGQVKYLRVEKEKMITSALRTGDFLELRKNDKALLCLPLHYIAGQMMVIRAFVLGLDLIAVNPASNPLEQINHEQFDFAAMTPMQVHNILESKNGFEKMQSIRKLIIGGGSISDPLMRSVNRLKNQTWHTYGMTETLTHVAMKKLTGTDKSEFFRALPGIGFRQDDHGCLVIDAPWLSEREIITNDLVTLIDKQSFLFRGRVDHVINTGGIKISPEQVETKLSALIASRFVVTGLPDDALGEKVVLVLEGNPGSEKNLMERIQKSGLDRYELPREIHFLYHFPETNSGKIIRDEIRNRLIREDGV